MSKINEVWECPHIFSDEQITLALAVDSVAVATRALIMVKHLEDSSTCRAGIDLLLGLVNKLEDLPMGTSSQELLEKFNALEECIKALPVTVEACQLITNGVLLTLHAVTVTIRSQVDDI